MEPKTSSPDVFSRSALQASGFVKLVFSLAGECYFMKGPLKFHKIST